MVNRHVRPNPFLRSRDTRPSRFEEAKGLASSPPGDSPQVLGSKALISRTPQPSDKPTAGNDTPKLKGSVVQEVYWLLVAALDPPRRRQRLQDALVGGAVLHLVGMRRYGTQGTSLVEPCYYLEGHE